MKLARRLAQSYTDLLIDSILLLKTNQLLMTLSVLEGASARFLESFFSASGCFSILSYFIVLYFILVFPVDTEQHR